jgi:hypothetical protein
MCFLRIVAAHIHTERAICTYAVHHKYRRCTSTSIEYSSSKAQKMQVAVLAPHGPHESDSRSVCTMRKKKYATTDAYLTCCETASRETEKQTAEGAFVLCLLVWSCGCSKSSI